ncbi:MAG: NAD(P)-dependent alcohol dehydrogenase [Acidobacteriota bacterium]
MQASVRYRYGTSEVLELAEIERPAPCDDEILVKVEAASANLGDWEILTGKPLFITAMATLMGPKVRHPVVPSGSRDAARKSGGFFKPRYQILGCDVAGRVEAVGRKVTRFEPGDEIFGMCAFGAFAEYVCIPETATLVEKPGHLTFEQAAALPQATYIAVQSIRDVGGVQPGQKVLINGAGGGAGSLAVQLAKLRGAVVTGVDNGKKLEWMRSIGADHVLDYTREDFTEQGERYDLIVDLVAQRSIRACRRALEPEGTYLVAGGGMMATFKAMLLGLLPAKPGKQKIAFLMAQDKAEDLAFVSELVKAGKVQPLIDKVYPLSEVPEALRSMAEGEALGKVVIAMSSASRAG